MNPVIRLASPADSGGILAVYKPYVENTAISFETEPPTPQAFRGRVERISEIYPYLVCELDGKIAAYAYASRFREREAYRFGVETSIYAAKEAQGRGIGNALYEALLELVAALGYKIAYAGIALPNEKSLSLHKSFGFIPLGTYRGTGYKLGKWIDVVWMERLLSDFSALPEEPRPVTSLEPDYILKVLKRAESRVGTRPPTGKDLGLRPTSANLLKKV